MSVGTTFKRPQPSSSPECSPCGGGNCFRQSAAVRRKCEETNGNTNGIVVDDDDYDDDLPIECIRQENGGVAVLQAPRCVQVEYLYCFNFFFDVTRYASFYLLYPYSELLHFDIGKKLFI